MSQLGDKQVLINQENACEDYDIVQAKACAGVGPATLPNRYNRPSALKEMEKSAAQNAEQLRLQSRGIDFLRDNPAFNEFITLIRTGSISI